MISSDDANLLRRVGLNPEGAVLLSEDENDIISFYNKTCALADIAPPKLYAVKNLLNVTTAQSISLLSAVFNPYSKVAELVIIGDKLLTHLSPEEIQAMLAFQIGVIKKYKEIADNAVIVGTGVGVLSWLVGGGAGQILYPKENAENDPPSHSFALRNWGRRRFLQESVFASAGLMMAYGTWTFSDILAVKETNFPEAGIAFAKRAGIPVSVLDSAFSKILALQPKTEVSR